jgi:Lar family restriction alleviation protein
MTTKIEFALKPCPFCGGKATLTIDDEYQVLYFFHVMCETCCAQSIGLQSKDEVIDSWNKRVGEYE